MTENARKYAALGAFLTIGLLPTMTGVILADFEPQFPPGVLAINADQTALISIPAPALTTNSRPQGAKLLPVAVKRVYITAYSSTPEETDDTPFITASGKEVRDGIVAANFLPIGTKIRIPELFGDKVFVVEDRMHPRITDVIDIWMPTKDEAKQFGKVYSEIEILEET
jgi:3D (Asp-Asp-Asp) domain-containing protein